MTTATTTAAGRAGRIVGTAARGLQWACKTIDWAEVGQIVTQGLKVLIVLTLLAGRGTRRAWDGLPVLSEQLGRRWAEVLAPAPAQPIPADSVPQLQAQPAPLSNRAQELLLELEGMTQRQLMALAGTRRRLSKRQLIAQLAAA